MCTSAAWEEGYEMRLDQWALWNQAWLSLWYRDVYNWLWCLLEMVRTTRRE